MRVCGRSSAAKACKRRRGVAMHASSSPHEPTSPLAGRHARDASAILLHGKCQMTLTERNTPRRAQLCYFGRRWFRPGGQQQLHAYACRAHTLSHGCPRRPESGGGSRRDCQCVEFAVSTLIPRFDGRRARVEADDGRSSRHFRLQTECAPVGQSKLAPIRFWTVCPMGCQVF